MHTHTHTHTYCVKTKLRANNLWLDQSGHDHPCLRKTHSIIQQAEIWFRQLPAPLVSCRIFRTFLPHALNRHTRKTGDLHVFILRSSWAKPQTGRALTYTDTQTDHLDLHGTHTWSVALVTLTCSRTPVTTFNSWVFPVNNVFVYLTNSDFSSTV